jgi:hypothetical protein
LSAASTLPPYNPIFSRFVDPERDEGEQLSGLVAYGLYKVAKREWAAELGARENRKPTELDLESYIRTWTESRLRGLADQAEGVLATYASTVVEAARPQIREEAIRGTFWAGVGLSITANAIYTIGLIVLLVILRYAGLDLLSIITAVGK